MKRQRILIIDDDPDILDVPELTLTDRVDVIKAPNGAEGLIQARSNNPDIIQKTIARIGNRLQHKVQTGVIRPQEIAREAEELMKEFAGNDTFVEMMNGIKSAFGMEDMDMARKAGKEGTARMSIARDRLRKKLDKKKEAAGSAPNATGAQSKAPSKK
ncbi:MAG: hypothetical protein WCJ71_11065 [Candidatus Omnitrophota bacterium]